MLKFGSLFSPKIALTIIKKQLKKQFNKDIDVFRVVYKAEKDEIYFLIDNKKYFLDSEGLKKAIQINASESLNKKQQLDYVILNIQNDEILSQVYYKENGVPLFVEHKL